MQEVPQPYPTTRVTLTRNNKNYGAWHAQQRTKGLVRVPLVAGQAERQLGDHAHQPKRCARLRRAARPCASMTLMLHCLVHGCHNDLTHKWGWPRAGRIADNRMHKHSKAGRQPQEGWRDNTDMRARERDTGLAREHPEHRPGRRRGWTRCTRPAARDRLLRSGSPQSLARRQSRARCRASRC